MSPMAIAHQLQTRKGHNIIARYPALAVGLALAMTAAMVGALTILIAHSASTAMGYLPPEALELLIFQDGFV